MDGAARFAGRVSYRRLADDDRLSVEQFDVCPDRRGASFRKPGVDFAAMKFVVAGD
jgi:hypothetical protein